MTILSIDGVSVVFGTGPEAVLAVDDVSLDVHAGEFLCLVGPSGCGKSTILKVVAGLVAAQRGAVTIAPDGASGGLDAVMVWQEHTLIPWRRIDDNVALSLELKGVPRAERRARATEALAKLGIADLLIAECYAFPPASASRAGGV